MRRLLNFLTAMVAIACVDNSDSDTPLPMPANFKTVTAILRDSLGKATFAIPPRFDTFFTWTNLSDCGKRCNHEQYRFQSKAHPTFKESGFFYEIPDIQIEQFTIVHSGYFPFHNSTETSPHFGRHQNFKNKLSSDPYNGHNVFDTIEKVDDRYYSIFYMAGFDSQRQRHFAKVAALTTIKGNEIEFHYDLRTKSTIDQQKYFRNATSLIRTIHLTQGF